MQEDEVIKLKIIDIFMLKKHTFAENIELKYEWQYKQLS